MEPIARSITELELADGARIFIAPMNTKDVVTLQGSVLGGGNMLPREKEIAHSLAVELLDAGTSKKSMSQIREALSSRGVSLSFSAGGDRTYFHASCLPEDLSFVLNAIVECLTEAAFPAKEIALAKTRMLGEIEEAKTDTRSQASRALARHLYDPSHVNYPSTLDERAAYLKAITRADLLSVRSLFGRGGLVLSIAGDVSPEAVARIVRSALKKLPVGTTTAAPKKANTKKQSMKEILVSIKDKANIDMNLGVSTQFTIDHPLYHAFAVFCSMLGGRDGIFSGHLMRTIRERDGLTYGIYVIPFGFSDMADGAFRIWGTFSPSTFTKAVKKVREEVSIFCNTCLTEEKLLKKQDQLAGSYVVGLSTTSGLAGMLHSIGVEGKPLSYVDAYPDLIRAVTVEDLKEVAKLIPFSQLSLAASGTFDNSSK